MPPTPMWPKVRRSLAPGRSVPQARQRELRAENRERRRCGGSAPGFQKSTSLNLSRLLSHGSWCLRVIAIHGAVWLSADDLPTVTSGHGLVNQRRSKPRLLARNKGPADADQKRCEELASRRPDGGFARSIHAASYRSLVRRMRR